METVLIILVVLLVIGNAVLLYSVLSKKPAGQDSSLILLQNQLQDLSRAVESKLGEGTRAMNDFVTTQSEQSHRLMSTISKQVTDQLIEVTRGVTETKESTKQVFTIAEQLNNLEKVLKNSVS